MSIGLIFMMSLACVAGTLILLARTIGMQRTLRHATVVDIVFTVLMVFVLAGTLTGVLIGIVAGLVMTGTLTLAKAAHKRAESFRATKAGGLNVDDWCPGGSPTQLSV